MLRIIKKLSEDEVRFRIMEAFKLSPCMTVGMMQSFLTSRVPKNVRNTVLAKMVSEGSIEISEREFASFRGYGSRAKVLTWKAGVQGGK